MLKTEIGMPEVNNWIRQLVDPWGAIIPFVILHKRLKENNLMQELDLLEEVMRSILNGEYKNYRYNNDQLNVLSERGKKAWMSNDITRYENNGAIRDFRVELRNIIRYRRIGDGFIEKVLTDNLNALDSCLPNLQGILVKARKVINIKNPSYEKIKQVFYFNDIQDLNDAKSRLDKLKIVYGVLTFFNYDKNNVNGGYVEVGGKRIRIAKFLNNLIDCLGKYKEGFLKMGIVGLRDNIILSQGTFSNEISIEDTDDPSLIISIGVKPAGTCLDYNYPLIDTCRCLVALLVDSNKKVVVVRNRGNLIARALPRVMKTDCCEPVILFEQAYSSTGDKFKTAMIEHLLSKA